jgi:hypothetical protein
MKILEKWSRFFGLVSVKQTGALIKVTGLDGLIMRKYFKDSLATDAVSKTMFTEMTDTSITLNQFFLPDFIYLLDRLKKEPKCPWSAKRTADKILHEIEKNTWWKNTLKEYAPIIDESQKKRLKWTPLPHQLEFLEYFGMLLPRYDLRGALLGAPPGTGKAQPLDAKILTPEGWIEMGDVTLDTRVVTPDGSDAAVTGIFPQGRKPIFKVVLEGGQSTECCNDHLWQIYCEAWEDPIQVIDTAHIRRLLAHGQSSVFLPVYDSTETKLTYLEVQSIEYVKDKPAQCIMVDHPDHLYITDDYIVTHNTFIDFLVATCVIPPSVAEVKIIISPKKAVHLVWEKTLKALFYKVPTSWVTGSGRPMPYTDTEYYIFNYEQLDQAITLGKDLVRRGIRYFVIVDESHNFADYRSNRTQKLIQLQTLSDNIYFIWASGSPILKMGAELASFLKCSDKRYDDDADRRFRKIYTAAPGRANEIFNHRLGLMMAFLVPKSVVSPPKLTVKELPVKLPSALARKFLMTTVREEMRAFIEERLKFYKPLLSGYQKLVNEQLDYHERTLTTRPQRRMFDEYRKNLKLVMRNPDVKLVEPLAMMRNYERAKLIPSLHSSKRNDFRGALSAIKNIKMKVRGEALGTVLSKRRSECAAYLGLYCQPEVIMKESLSKTLFFASSVLPVKILGHHLQKEGFHPVMVFSDTNSQLTHLMNLFEQDPDVNPVIATMQSLSEAVPVIAASTVVLLNRPYRQAVWDQVVARAWRLGQVHDVTVLEVTLDTGGEPNVSSTADAILSDIRDAMREILGDTFAGPDPDEREYKDAINASDKEHLALLDTDASGSV